MNRRFLQDVRQWQRLSGLVQRLSFQTNASHNYAIGITRALEQPTTGAFADSCRVPIQTIRHWQREKTMLMRDFATAPQVTSSTMRQPHAMTVPALIDKLDSYYRQNGQLNPELFERLIKTLETKPGVFNQLLSTDNIRFLLLACGTQMPAQLTKKRLTFFQRLWTYLAEHEQLSAADYITRLHVLQHNRAPLPDFQAFLPEVQKRDANQAYSLQDIYMELLKTAASCGNIQQATELLAEMRAQQIALTERHFNALLLGHARNHDLDGCKSVLDNMLAAGITPSVETQSILVSAYVENNKPALSAELLNKFHGQFAAAQVVSMLHSLLYVDAPEAEMIEKIVRELPNDFAVGAEVPLPLRQVCVELLHNGKLAIVKTIVTALPTPQFNENQNIDTFGVFLLQELFRSSCSSEEIIGTAHMLCETGKNIRALHITTEIALRRNPDTALVYLEALAQQEPLRPHYFWPILLYNYKHADGEAGVLQVLQQMKALNVTCDHETFAHYALPHLPLTFKQPEQALKALDAAGVKISQVFGDVLTHLLLQQRLEEAYTLLELYPTKVQIDELIPVLSNAAINARATRRYQQYGRLLAALAKRCENRKADWVGQLLLHMLNTQIRLRSDLKAFQRFISEMSKFGLIISPRAIEGVQASLQDHAKNDFNLTPIMDMLGRMSDRSVILQQTNQDNAVIIGGRIKITSVIKHPRDMTLDELEFHLVELEAKNLNTRGVLRRLLQLCVRDGQLKRALEVEAQCEKLNVQVSAGMLASIFDLYIKLLDLPKATANLQRLQKTFPGFLVDEHKMIDYAALLVHENQLDAAKQLLEQRAATQKIMGGDYVLKNVWNFLTNVAQLAAQMTTLPKEQNLTRENFHFLLKLRYCKPHNAVLGPIVREWMFRGDIVSAVTEFQQLATQYKCTPLQFEILSLLVRLINRQEADVAHYGGVSAETAQELLSTVTETIAKVYGALNMNSALLLAFAESGTDNQLRRLLINPEFRINQEVLLKNCEYLGEEGAVTTLLRLARGARGFSRVIDEQGIYNMLLSHFAKGNKCELALNLYEQLEADDELKISQEFLRNLVELLRINNVEIPSNLALRAQII